MTSRPSSSFERPEITDAFAGFEGEIRVVEQRDVTERKLRGREGNDSHILCAGRPGSLGDLARRKIK